MRKVVRTLKLRKLKKNDSEWEQTFDTGMPSNTRKVLHGL